jgi:glycerol-3-phosphate dehydrogenase
MTFDEDQTQLKEDMARMDALMVALKQCTTFQEWSAVAGLERGTSIHFMCKIAWDAGHRAAVVTISGPSINAHFSKEKP